MVWWCPNGHPIQVSVEQYDDHGDRTQSRSADPAGATWHDLHVVADSVLDDQLTLW